MVGNHEMGSWSEIRSWIGNLSGGFLNEIWNRSMNLLYFGWMFDIYGIVELQAAIGFRWLLSCQCYMYPVICVGLPLLSVRFLADTQVLPLVSREKRGFFRLSSGVRKNRVPCTVKFRVEYCFHIPGVFPVGFVFFSAWKRRECAGKSDVSCRIVRDLLAGTADLGSWCNNCSICWSLCSFLRIFCFFSTNQMKRWIDFRTKKNRI